MIPPNKTLIIRLSSAGDVILSSPLLRVLRRRFPDSQIDYVTKKEYAGLIKSNHNLNFTYEFDAATGFLGLKRLKERIRTEHYDLVIDIHNSLRSRFLRSIRGVGTVATIDKRIVERTALVKFKKNLYRAVVSVADRYIEPLQRFGIENDGEGLELHIPDEVSIGVAGKIAKLQLNKFEKVVGFCPSAKHETKKWLQDRFTELGIRLVREYDAKILIFGGPSDVERCSAIARGIIEEAGPARATDFSGQFTLLETAAAVEYCDVILTNDSGLMHIAAAMKRKVVAIFGSTVREFGFFPYGTESVVLERKGLYCRPCSHIGRNVCPEGHFRCMKEIEVNEVFSEAARFLKGRQVIQENS